MPEPTTVGLAALVAYVGKDAVSKMLGPTADYLGGQLKEFTEKRFENVGKIFSNAEKKLGNKLNRPGQVPPKVLKTIIDEGSYSDDNVTVEYLGGVLASSRTNISRDDRGSRLAKMIDNLSAYQIRSHYLIYSTISALFSNSDNSFDIQHNRLKMQLFMPVQGYFDAMAFTSHEWVNPQLLNHIFHGLDTDGLIDNSWRFGNRATLTEFVSSIPSDGIICSPTALGAELLLWAFGHGDKELDFLLTANFSSKIEGIPVSVPNALPVKNLKNKST